MPLYSKELWDAVYGGDFAAMKTIFQQTEENADVLLHELVQNTKPEVVKIFLDVTGTKWINGFDPMTFSPLMWAARLNKMDHVILLIKAGADINAHDESRIGNTALHEAVECADYELIEYLLNSGADPTIQGWMNLNSLDKALNRLKSNDSEENQKIVELLKKHFQGKNNRP